MTYWFRLILMLLFDSCLINLSIGFSLWLRFEGEGGIPANYLTAFFSLIPWYTFITLGALYAMRLYHRMWKYASIGELFRIVKAVTTSTAIVIILIYTIPLSYLPRSVYIMSWVFMIIFIGGSRLSWRLLRDLIIKESNKKAKRTLIIGAGDAGAMVARELNNNQSLNLLPVGFIDDSPLKQKLSIFGIPVLGSREQIPFLTASHGIEEIIIAMPSAEGKTIREIVNICQATGVRLRIFEGADDLLHSRSKFRDVQLEDLLRREPVKLDLEEIAAYLQEKTVLVSGAGGSIGSELCRQVCRHRPQRLILLECSENNLFDIDNELRESFPEQALEAELADVRNREKLQVVFEKYSPQVIFHAAAFKHVPMMEMHPEEALNNNVLGTKNIAEMADKYRSETFILISTDKAVNPTNVMGASKRIAELIAKDINRSSQTRFAAVRFGNVLGSRGSVVPTFLKQIQKGGPLTVTHPDMTRYFMTIPEAVELVIQAGAIAQGGEIFVLDMGEPVKIADLANDLIRLLGYDPELDIEIKYTGIRPGEKLYEELFSGYEEMAATRHQRIFISSKELDERYNGIRNNIAAWIKNLPPDRNEIMRFIQELIPEYSGSEANEKPIPRGEVIYLEERGNRIKKSSGIK